jgi:hypothetical protein
LNPNPDLRLRTEWKLEHVDGLLGLQLQFAQTWSLLKMSELTSAISHNGRSSCFRTRDRFARNGE